jgi:DNA-binding response OmpR family regulator
MDLSLKKFLFLSNSGKDFRILVKASNLIICPSIGKHLIRRNDESRIVIIDAFLLKFTPREYKLLVMLLNGERVVPDSELVQNVFDREISPAIREKLDRHIDNIKNKVRVVGLSIHRVNKLGYVLLEAS